MSEQERVLYWKDRAQKAEAERDALLKGARQDAYIAQLLDLTADLQGRIEMLESGVRSIRSIVLDVLRPDVLPPTMQENEEFPPGTMGRTDGLTDDMGG